VISTPLSVRVHAWLPLNLLAAYFDSKRAGASLGLMLLFQATPACEANVTLQNKSQMVMIGEVM
jgi:hypothetical protein